MAITPIDPLPAAPQRIDKPAVFIERADAHVAALTPWTDQVNVLGIEIEDIGNTATTSAADAANSAGQASLAADASAANANFKGLWASLTGVLNIPATGSHVGKTWQLLVNLADVTLSEPGVTGDWSEVGFVASWGAPVTANQDLLPNTSRNINVSGGAVTLALPGIMAVGDYFTVHVYDATSSGAVATIDRNTHVIGRKGVDIDPNGTGNLTLENGDTVTMVAITGTQVEIV